MHFSQLLQLKPENCKPLIFQNIKIMFILKESCDIGTQRKTLPSKPIDLMKLDLQRT